jgi:hypothetical protein
MMHHSQSPPSAAGVFVQASQIGRGTIVRCTPQCCGVKSRQRWQFWPIRLVQRPRWRMLAWGRWSLCSPLLLPFSSCGVLSHHGYGFFGEYNISLLILCLIFLLRLFGHLCKTGSHPLTGVAHTTTTTPEPSVLPPTPETDVEMELDPAILWVSDGVRKDFGRIVESFARLAEGDQDKGDVRMPSHISSLI